MRLTNKIKSLRAEVRVSVSGGFSNVFLSNCKSCRIFLYDMVVRPDKIEATVSPAALNGVFAAAKNAGMHVQILSRKGLRYFLLRYRKRYGVTAGVFLFAFLLTVLSSFYGVSRSEVSSKRMARSSMTCFPYTGSEPARFYAGSIQKRCRRRSNRPTRISDGRM